MTLSELNECGEDEAYKAFLECCGSIAWAHRLLSLRPFRSQMQLLRDAENEWCALEKSDWLEAFSKHPQIGVRNSASAWANDEQSGMARANAETAEALHHLNREYLDKFGWIYIVCATGKSGEEMREDIERRLCNYLPDELGIAAAEQAKIMHIRLGKLLDK